jgi:hypothetical protein
MCHGDELRQILPGARIEPWRPQVWQPREVLIRLPTGKILGVTKGYGEKL